MRSCVRFSFLALLVGVLVAVAAPAAAQRVRGRKIRRDQLRSRLRKLRRKPCRTSAPEEPTEAEAEAEGFTQAGGHVPLRHHRLQGQHRTSATFPKRYADRTSSRASAPTSRPDSRPTRRRCRNARRRNSARPNVAGSGLFPPPNARSARQSEIGTNEVDRRTRRKPTPDVTADRERLQPRSRTPGLRIGVRRRARAWPPLGQPGVFAHTMIEGNVEWGQEAAEPTRATTTTTSKSTSRRSSR